MKLSPIYLAGLLTLAFGLAVGGHGFSETKKTSDLGDNFADDVGHRIHVIFSGVPYEFRQAFVDADTEGLIDDIATPTSLNEADLAIIYLSEVEDFKRSKFFPDLEQLKEKIIDGIASPSFEIGLTVSDANGPRPFRLYFYNEAAAKNNIAEEGLSTVGVDQTGLECLARRLYALSIFENAERVLSAPYGDCKFQ